jgi:hypothetical protein
MSFNGQTSPSMNGKAYKGLSMPGLAAHIASSILLWNIGKQGTINDCKHAIAHNVRAFQRRLITEEKVNGVLITSNALKAEKSLRQLEHAIPVGCLMNLLLFMVKTSELSEAATQIDKLLRGNTVLVWVTKDEHAELNKKYQCKMPDGFDTFPWKDKLARYSQTPSVSSLMPKRDGSADKSRPSKDDLDAELEDDFSTPVQDPLLRLS